MNEKIAKVFKGEACAYAVMYHGVGIGKWDGKEFNFHVSVEFDWDFVTELRVFSDVFGEERELRFVRLEDGTLKERDSANINAEQTKDVDYLLYGTSHRIEDDYTILSEDRGGKLYFPKEIQYEPLEAKQEDKEVITWLSIRNYLRFSEDLRLEVCDYAFTGFRQGRPQKENKDERPKEVKLNG